MIFSILILRFSMLLPIKMLSQLLLFKPKYLIFESLLSRPSHGFTLIQSLYQSSSPCTFLSEKEFVNYITSQGYTLATERITLLLIVLFEIIFRFPLLLCLMSKTDLQLIYFLF